MVADNCTRPGGRNPLSASSSHSYPSVPMPGPSVTLAPGASAATGVLRQIRRLLYCEGTLMSVVPLLTTKNWPVTAFSGRPPSPGGLNRGSRQVPVHVAGLCGSTCASKCVSLYETSVRVGVWLASMLGSQRVFQNISYAVFCLKHKPES